MTKEGYNLDYLNLDYNIEECNNINNSNNKRINKESKREVMEIIFKEENGKLVEFIEAPKCKFFVATQAHPEFKSRPLHTHPLFMEFIRAAK